MLLSQLSCSMNNCAAGVGDGVGWWGGGMQAESHNFSENGLFYQTPGPGSDARAGAEN